MLLFFSVDFFLSFLFEGTSDVASGLSWGIFLFVARLVLSFRVSLVINALGKSNLQPEELSELVRIEVMPSNWPGICTAFGPMVLCKNISINHYLHCTIL